jgi:DNA-binding transcriptional LysR family regulator
MAYTLKQLRYAVAVVECGSIIEAAQKSGISQSAISVALKSIEGEFGLSIFLRQPSHRITLTPAGRRFIEHVRHLLEYVDVFDAESRGLGHRLDGTIQVGCFLPTAPFIMPLILRAMKELYPNVTIIFEEQNLEQLNVSIKSAQIEVALMYDMHPDKQIQFETLVEAKPYVLLSEQDPLAKKKSIRLRDLRGKEMVSFGLPFTQDYFLDIVETGGRLPNISYRTKSYEMMRSLVASQAGYAILIMYPHTNRAYDGSILVTRPIQDDLPLARYGLAMAKDYEPRRIVQAFIEVCRSTLKDEGAAAKFFLRT